MANAAVVEEVPTAVSVTVEPKAARSRERRPREYLHEHEIKRLMEAARKGRWGHRNSTAILLAYQHGLRSIEVVGLRWDDVNFKTGRLHVRRGKDGVDGEHPLWANESRALRKLRRESPESNYVFVSERGSPLSKAGYQRMVARAGKVARFSFKVSSHQLRHSCGYKLVNDNQSLRAIQSYLGHKSPASTARYTALASGRFRNFFREV